MVILDSCVLIAYFRENELNHDEAVKIMEQSRKIIINDYVLGEIYTVIMLRDSQTKAKEVLNWIIRDPLIQTERLLKQELDEVIDTLNQNNAKLSFVDVSLVVQAKSLNCELITFDKKLKNYANSWN